MGTSHEVTDELFLSGVYLFQNAMASQGKRRVPKAGAEMLTPSITCWFVLWYVVAVRPDRDCQAHTKRP